jgi:uncharacterized protein YbjT (DUF2867 family)
MPDVDLVTGAFGYTGSFIAERLLAAGRQVRTLTRRPPVGRPLGQRIESIDLRFDDEPSLVVAMRGVDTFYNTYWRRFPRPGIGFDDIVAESELLIAAAAKARIRRIVHFSVSNAAEDAPTSYFRAKAEVEKVVRSSGVSHAILRPTLLCGPGDILLNNLAWTLRRSAVFGMPGSGEYSVQPVLVTDVADLAIRLANDPDNLIITAAGPETYRFVDLVQLIRESIGARARIIGVPPTVALWVSRLIGRIVHDVVLTRDEITELMGELLVSDEPPTCPTSVRAWLATEANTIGRHYSSELERNYRGRAGPEARSAGR